MGPVSFLGAEIVLKQSVVVLGLLLAGCSGSDDQAPAGTLDKSNITKRMTNAMVEQGSLHVSMTIDAGTQKIKMAGDQILGKDAGSSAMSVEYAESGEEPLTMRLVKGIVYANFGELSDDKYVRIDPADTTSAMGRSFAPVMDDLDITKSIRQFEDAITDVDQEDGQKEIDGVQTTPYRVTIDVDRAIKSGALDKDSKLRPGASVEYTFYIDGQDLLRRMEFTIGPAKARMDVTNLGDPVDIAAPPADQVIDEDAFMDAA